MSNFVERVKGVKKRPFCTLEDAIAVQKIAESARISSIQERVVSLDELSL